MVSILESGDHCRSISHYFHGVSPHLLVIAGTKNQIQVPIAENRVPIFITKGFTVVILRNSS